MDTIIFETPRLIVKNININEYDLISELEKDPEVMKFIGHGARTDEEILEGIHKAVAHFKKYGFTFGSVYEKATGNFIGRGGLFKHQWDDTSHEIEIGYRFFKQYWGQGYASELLTGLLQYGFETLKYNQICAAVFPDYVVSAHILKKNGAKYIGMVPYWNKYQVEKYIFEKTKSIHHNTILAIETSCDETAVSIVNYDAENKTVCVLAHVVESQNESHAPFGGVVPEIAARDHLSKIDSITHQALAQSNLKITDITSICVTLGPGLIGALMVGVLYARGIVNAHRIPLIGVNHVRAHLSPCFFLPSNFRIKNDLQKSFPIKQNEFPILALTVSGGHCHLTFIKSNYEHHILGRTLDDACGEAFDKIAKLLGLGYPGGAALEALALKANPAVAGKIKFVQPFANKDSAKNNRYNFSYSGLKTAALLLVKSNAHDPANIAFAFQEAALLQLKTRVCNVLHDFPAIKTIFIAGGVAQNKAFRNLFADLPLNPVFAPPELCSDNATMIALQSILDNSIDALHVHPFSRYPYNQS